MFHLVPAVTAAHANMACRFDHFAGALIVQHVQCILIGQGGFLYEGSPQLRIAASKQFPNKIFFHVHVFMEEFAKYFLVDIVADTH